MRASDLNPDYVELEEPIEEYEIVKDTKAARRKAYKQSPEYKEQELGKNNFVNVTFKIPIVRQYSKRQYTRFEDNSTGHVTWKKAKYDSEYGPTTKIFTWPENRQMVNKLSGKAKEVLLWIIYNLYVADDYIEITRDNCMKELNISSNTTFLNAVKDLVRLNFIAPTLQRKDTYWINPHYFFNGERMKVFENNKEIVYNYTDDNNIKLK